MPRYIDVGYIINRITEERRRWGDDYDVEQVLGDIEDAPTIEAVHVVRCKDCVYYEMLNNNEHYCDAIYRDLSGDDEGVCFEPPQDHFCAYGIRRKANDAKGHEG